MSSRAVVPETLDSLVREVAKTPMGSITRVSQTGYAVTAWHDLFMAAFRPRLAEYDYSDLDLWLSAFAREQPGKFGYLAIVEPGVGPGRRASKRQLEEALFKHNNRFRFAAIVLEDTGFKGAAVRGVLSMFGILSGKCHPESFHPDVGAAARWMHTIYSRTEGLKPTLEEIVAAISDFKSEYPRILAA
jgi:hypothetical protein